MFIFSHLRMTEFAVMELNQALLDTLTNFCGLLHQNVDGKAGVRYLLEDINVYSELRQQIFCTGHKREILLQRELVERENVFWRTEARRSTNSDRATAGTEKTGDLFIVPKRDYVKKIMAAPEPAPSGKTIPLYQVAHSRAGDKGNDLNFSIIPHFPGDFTKLRSLITPEWVRGALSTLLDLSPFSDPMSARRDGLEQVTVEIYEAAGIHSLNVVVRNALDGGVNRSRRIDRHGKTVSDLILCQEIVLPHC